MNQKYNTPPPDRFRDAAELGLRVFPAQPQKKTPALKWKDYQTQAPTGEDLARWDSSNLNVGVITGMPDGFVVLDVDNEDAQLFVDEELGLPPTATVVTGRGRHYYFRAPSQEIRNAVGLADLKLDLRGFGGYVIGAGSIHPDGSMYQWEKTPTEVGFAPFPEQLRALIETKKPTKRSDCTRTHSEVAMGPVESGIERYIAYELGEAIKDLSAAAEGERNDTLFKVSARMARHVAAAGIDWSEVAAALGATAANAGLAEAEIAATIESGWKAGRDQPTPWVSVAVGHVYLAAQNCFYHLASRTEFDKEGFNGQHGHKHQGRRTFANFLLAEGYIRKVSDITYEPLEPRLYVERDGLEFLNTFRPSSVTAVEGDPQPFVDFMIGLVPEADERDHLIKIMAFTVRHPGQKVRHAVLLRTAVQGVGKSMFADIWGHLLGLHNVRKTTPREMFSDFQSYLRESLLVLCEEMNLGMGMKPYNELKDVLTSDTAVINEKFKKQRVWRVYATMVFFSNLEKPILVEQSDRRVFYIDAQAIKRQSGYYAAFSAWWRSSLGVIRAYLDSIDLEDFNPHAPPPMTAAKLGLIEGSKSELAQDLQWAIKERRGCFDRDLVTLDQVALEMDRRFGVRKLADALKEIGAASLGQQRVGGRKLSLWAVRNAEFWRWAMNETRQQEVESQEGIFAFLDGTGVDVVHINSVRDAAGLVAGFEELFGLAEPVG